MCEERWRRAVARLVLAQARREGVLVSLRPDGRPRLDGIPPSQALRAMLGGHREAVIDELRRTGAVTPANVG